jgi:hypothetical protein
MTIRHAWLFVLIPLIAAPALSQERSSRNDGPQPPEKLSEKIQQAFKEQEQQAQQEVSKRDFKFKTEAEPVKTQLFRPDPKLLKNKFVANFVLIAAELNWSDSASFAEFRRRQNAENSLARYYPDRLRPLLAWEQTYIFRPHHGVRDSDAISLHELFKQLAENCQAESRPDQALVDLLTSAVERGDIQRRRIGFLSDSGKRVAISELRAWQFTLFAPTTEEARQRSATILQLLDCGLSRPMQRFALEQGKASLASARQAESEIATANKAIAVEQEKLDKPSEISADILSQLKAQKIMVAIELSGLIARGKACDEMLTRELPASTLASIGDMKVKAEIDRIGIKEKLDQINALIAEGEARQAARARLITLTEAKRRALSSLSSAQTTAAQYADIFELYSPLQLENNQITISPIEWTN